MKNSLYATEKTIPVGTLTTKVMKSIYNIYAHRATFDGKRGILRIIRNRLTSE